MSDSSPMADSTVPTLTKTTSSPGSPRASSVESDVLTPPPEEPAVKRKAPSSSSGKNGIKKQKTTTETDTEQNGGKKPYCHQCRLAVEPENLLRCTKLRKHSKLQPPRACNYVWCERDLVKRYGIDVDSIRARKGRKEDHDDKLGYTFECPCCLEQCQNATCRKKKGLEPLGNVVKKAEDSGMTMAEFLRKSDAGEIDEAEGSSKSKKKAAPKAKAVKEKSGDDSESELSDIDTPPEQAKTKKKATPKKKADTKAKPAAKTKSKAKTTKADLKAKAKNAKDAKSKAAKAKEAKAKKAAEPKPKPAPKKKVIPEPPHPEIKNVETRLSFEEAEQRMFLREFVVRFRGILGLPERSLAPLDDFDHPLPEATVRSVAGGLLDLIINDGGVSLGVAPALIETVEDLREELRHYADLARFAKIFAEVQELFDIELAPEPSNESRERNERALREILDLDEGEATPTWATDALRRGRAAASRIPSATEVVRMLIGLCNYVINLEAVRQDMDPGWMNQEPEYRREATRQAREENKRWEAEKKKIMAARVRCTSAAATRANTQLMDARQAEHRNTLAGIELVPRTVAARKLTRFQPLGLDAHDRKYYLLTPRLLDEERYRPSGWARGLYIFGRGFPWDDTLPQAVERWMRVDTSAEIAKLDDWVGYEMFRKLDDMAKEGYWPVECGTNILLTEEEREHALEARAKREEAEREREAERLREREEADAARPKVNGISKADFNDMAPGSSSAPASEAGSEQSDLSSAPSQPEDLLALLDQEYTPSYDKMHERWRLVADLMEVKQFFTQLELRNY